MTGRDLISASLRLIGALASGETPAAQEATDGLSALNRMVDSWSNEGLMIFSLVTEVFPLTLNQQTYTMGVGGNFNTSRTQSLELAYIRLTGQNPAPDLPVQILTLEEWSAITIKVLASSIPIYLYQDGSYPLDNLSLWPIPNQACSLVLSSSKPISQVSTLDTIISLPPGYEEALTYNLAVRLAPEFGKQTAPEVGTIAIESKASLKRTNHRTRYLQVDEALRTQSGAFNYYTGESTP